MTQDEIIRMAREAGLDVVTTNNYSTGFKPVTHLYQNMYGIERIERFFNLAFAAGAAHEREACAKVCDEIDQRDDIHPDHVALECAADIRARSEK